MKFSEAVKYVRTKKLFLSQVDFAKELGISFPTLNRIENEAHYVTSLRVRRKFLPYFEKYNIDVEE